MLRPNDPPKYVTPKHLEAVTMINFSAYTVPFRFDKNGVPTQYSIRSSSGIAMLQEYIFNNLHTDTTSIEIERITGGLVDITTLKSLIDHANPQPLLLIIYDFILTNIDRHNDTRTKTKYIAAVFINECNPNQNKELLNNVKPTQRNQADFLLEAALVIVPKKLLEQTSNSKQEFSEVVQYLELSMQSDVLPTSVDNS